MSEENRKSAMVVAGKLQTIIRGIKSLPQHRLIVKESKGRQQKT